MAQACGIEDDLGEKEREGVLKSQASRAKFLSDPGHRIRFVYTPKHSSWLNQVEIWFSTLVRKLLRRSSFVSLGDLRRRILEFIDYFNRTMSKPIKWLYSPRPLKDDGTSPGDPIDFIPAGRTDRSARMQTRMQIAAHARITGPAFA